jgi:hypothetical protein
VVLSEVAVLGHAATPGANTVLTATVENGPKAARTDRLRMAFKPALGASGRKPVRRAAKGGLSLGS